MKKKSLKESAVHAPADDAGASDETTEAATDTGKRKAVSKRAYLLADGTEADKIEEAAGARYSLIGGKSFDEMFSNDKLKTMFAIFGFHTKIGNVANTVLNDKDEPGDVNAAGAAIAEFIEQAAAGVWAERTGGVGVKIDKEALAKAIVEVGTAGGKSPSYAKILAKLESDPAYVRAVRQNAAIATAYAALVGKPTKTVDELLAGMDE